MWWDKTGHQDRQVNPEATAVLVKWVNVEKVLSTLNSFYPHADEEHRRYLEGVSKFGTKDIRQGFSCAVLRSSYNCCSLAGLWQIMLGRAQNFRWHSDSASECLDVYWFWLPISARMLTRPQQLRIDLSIMLSQSRWKHGHVRNCYIPKCFLIMFATYLVSSIPWVLCSGPDAPAEVLVE